MDDRWNGQLRADGLFLCADMHGNWVILPKDDRPALNYCPCCGKPFPQDQIAAARFVADRVYPMKA